MITGCLHRLVFADEVLVGVDRRTVDDTAAKALQCGATVVEVEPGGFAAMRNQLLASITTDYVLFVDADERIPTGLRKEIEQRLAGAPSAYRIRVDNWFYGHRVRRSGYREQPIRLLPVSGVTYSGDIHERPSVPVGLPVSTMENPLVHLSHRSVSENLAKTARYADVEAFEMMAANHPPVTRLTLVVVLTKALIRHLIIGQGFRDGTAGFIESAYQPFSHFCVYARLWELQQRPSLEERYRMLEDNL